MTTTTALHMQFDHVAASTPEKVAIKTKAECITYGQLYDQSRREASWLHAMLQIPSNKISYASKFSRSVVPAYFVRNRPRLCNSGTT